MDKIQKQIRVELQDVYGGDKEIANAAWTSSLDLEKKNSRTEKDVKRIVNMLADSGHSTPFESVIFRFWIKLPVTTDRQIMTHRLQSSSGMSGRYRTMPDEWLEAPMDVIRIFDKVPGESQESPCGIHYLNEYNDLTKQTNDAYKSCLTRLKKAEKDGHISNGDYKRVREFYRGILPQNNMTERVSIMNLRAWSNFYKLRSDPAAQPEIQEIAKQMLEAIEASGKCSEAIQALKRNNWNI